MPSSCGGRPKNTTKKATTNNALVATHTDPYALKPQLLLEFHRFSLPWS